MLGLTAWISALVGAFWIGFASILPTFLICAVGPILTFRILHIIWLKLSKMFNPSYDKWVEVFDYNWSWKKSKNWKYYYSVAWNKFFPSKHGAYVIPKEWIPFYSDYSLLSDDKESAYETEAKIIQDDIDDWQII